MRRFLTVSIPIVMLAIFICIMLSGSILKKTLEGGYDIPRGIDNIIEKVSTEDWDGVSDEVENLEKEWYKVIKRIQFSAERNEINDISTNITRLQGAILARDKSSSLMELKEAYMHWENIGK